MTLARPPREKEVIAILADAVKVADDATDVRRQAGACEAAAVQRRLRANAATEFQNGTLGKVRALAMQRKH